MNRQASGWGSSRYGLQKVSCTRVRITLHTEQERRSTPGGAQATSLRSFTTLFRTRLCRSLKIPVVRHAFEFDLLPSNRIAHGLNVI